MKRNVNYFVRSPNYTPIEGNIENTDTIQGAKGKKMSTYWENA